MRAVIESPLAGDFQRNFCYALWCARALWLRRGAHAIGSHMLNPWFMDDLIPVERQAGIDNPWVWQPDVPHVFCEDLGVSRGMGLASERCARKIPTQSIRLQEFAPDCWAAFERGEWPPHTPAFRLADAS